MKKINSTRYHSELSENKSESELIDSFVIWLEVGFSGMFGDNVTSPQDDAYDCIPLKLKEFKEQLKKIRDK